MVNHPRLQAPLLEVTGSINPYKLINKHSYCFRGAWKAQHQPCRHHGKQGDLGPNAWRPASKAFQTNSGFLWPMWKIYYLYSSILYLDGQLSNNQGFQVELSLAGVQMNLVASKTGPESGRTLAKEIHQLGTAGTLP